MDATSLPGQDAAHPDGQYGSVAKWFHWITVGLIAAALPTVGRLGYALGASFVGILANRAGFAEAAGPAEMQQVARAIFAGSLPVAVLGCLAMTRFVTARR